MNFKEYFKKQYAPRWIILQIDIFLSIIAFFVAFLLRFNFELDRLPLNEFTFILPLYVLVRVVFFRIFRVYRGITRYTGVQDAKRLFYAITLGSGVIWAISLSIGVIYDSREMMPLSVGVIDYFASLVLLTSFRIGVKIVYSEMMSSNEDKKRIVIFGAGRSGLITKRTIDQDGRSAIKIVGFFDDNENAAGKIIEGVPIIPFADENFDELVEKLRFEELVISIQNISSKRKQEVVDLCLKHGIKVKIVPPANKWVDGELSLSQIQKIRIEDLLEREPIVIDNQLIGTEIHDKTILVTGAAGSIGSELVRQVLKYLPAKLILVDNGETPLAEFKLELEEKFSYINFEFIVGDVRFKDRIRKVFEDYDPDVVFHVAAYKHVPMMEINPTEAILTNVLGTKNMADLSLEFAVDKFVMISTDKAVNPTNIMGATKRIAEIYVQSLYYHVGEDGNKTKFITTRFGNVLGSNGSVIPRFRSQIEKGGPVTVTHPEITRYFMTIPEACQLILEAGTMGKGGEIFIFDMGRDVKIVDLAKKMIKLSGYEPDKDVKIVFTGLRPGEKIKEELLNNLENTLPTHHNKIMIARVRKSDYVEICEVIENLITSAKDNNELDAVRVMKGIVPEFISNNSVFTSLDSPSKNLKHQEN